MPALSISACSAALLNDRSFATSGASGRRLKLDILSSADSGSERREEVRYLRRDLDEEEEFFRVAVGRSTKTFECELTRLLSWEAKVEMGMELSAWNIVSISWYDVLQFGLNRQMLWVEVR
jgi:hypothetical protein